MAQADITAPPTLRVVAPKPKMTIYYALLIIALVAMLIACLFLYLEIRRFGGFGTVPQRIAWLDQAEQGVGWVEVRDPPHHTYGGSRGLDPPYTDS